MSIKAKKQCRAEFKNFLKNLSIPNEEEYTKVILEASSHNTYVETVSKYVKLYRERWGIETMFRVHDEARIKSKSVKPIIRLFYFMLSMLLLLIWNLYAKELYGFKQFIILLDKMSNNAVVSRAN